MKLNKKDIRLSKLITLKMLGVFALLSGLWILLSNKIISLTLNLSAELTKIFLYNGWLYTIVTGLIFYFLISKFNMHIYEETSLVSGKKVDRNIKKWPWYLIILILLFSLGIFQVDSLFYKIQKVEYKEESENELKSISALKINYLESWKNERLKNSDILLSNAIVHGKLENCLLNLNNSGDLNDLKKLFLKALSDSNYNSVSLLDLKGNILMYASKEPDVKSRNEKNDLQKYYNYKKQYLSDFRLADPDTKEYFLDLFVPVFKCLGCDSSVIGAVLFEINPQKHLFPYLKSWPTNSLTAESVLLKCENDSVSFLSPPAFLDIKESFSKRHILNSELAGLNLHDGKNITVEAKDYRDKKILASVQKVSGTDWYLVTKIDQEEIYSDLLKSAKLFTVLVIVIILIGGISIILYWRKHIAKHYRKQYETELEKLAIAKNFEYMSKYANDIIFLTDENWNIVEVNEKAVSVYGYSRSEFLEMKIYELRNQEQKDLFDEQMSILNKTGGILLETIHDRKDGTSFYVESSIRKFNIDDNVFYQGVLRDITERKSAENELKKAKDKAEEMSRLKSNFLMNMGHELRTPLNGILGYADLLSEAIEDTRQKEMADMIYQGGKRLNRTMNSIMDLTVIESTEIKLNLKTLNLAEIVKDSINNFCGAAKEKNLVLTCGFDEGIYANLDSGAVNRITYNLIHNAITYTKEGCIKINVGSLTEDGNKYAFFRVADTGIGIPGEYFGIIFEPFRQVSEGIDRDFEGAGLGLTITKKYTELMNGKIRLKSNVGLGSEFTVLFPLVKKDFSLAEELKKVTVKANEIINKREKRILILNGNDDILNSKSNILKCICRTETVDSEVEALEIAKKMKFDAILMELGPENTDRLNIASSLREIKGYEQVPILAVSDSGFTEGRDTCLQKGCTHYITKPFQFSELMQLVNQLLGS